MEKQKVQNFKLRSLAGLVRENKMEALGLLAMLVVAVFFRFWRLKELFPFTMDEAYEAYLIEKIINFGHWPLIGVSAADTGIYLGPGILYLGAIPYWLFKGDPVGVALLGSAIGVVTTMAVWWVGREWGGKLAGWATGMMYASSWLIAIYDRRFWNPSLMPLLSVVIGYALWRIVRFDSGALIFGGKQRLFLQEDKLIKKQKRRKPSSEVFEGFSKGIWWVVLGLGLGGVLHAHLSGLIWFPIALGVLGISKIKAKRVKSKMKIENGKRRKYRWIAGGVVAFFLMISPLIVFDLRHGGVNAKAVVGLVQRKKGGGSRWQEISSRSLTTLGRVVLTPGGHNLATEVLDCSETNRKKGNSLAGWVIWGTGLGILIWEARKDKVKRWPVGLMLATTGINWLLLVLSGRWAEYYWLPSFPWVAIGVGWGIAKLVQRGKRKGESTNTRFGLEWLGMAIFGGLLLFNFLSLLETRNELGLRKKKEVLTWVKEQVGEASYQLESWGGCHRFEGYGYLAQVYAHRPARSYDDAFFKWIFESEKPESKSQDPEYLVSLVSGSRDEAGETQENFEKKAEELRRGATDWRKFGEVEVIISKISKF